MEQRSLPHINITKTELNEEYIMNHHTKLEYLNEIKTRYKHSLKSEKKIILDEFCKICCYNRNYAIQLLNPKQDNTRSNSISKPGPLKKYDDPVILEVITYLWSKTNLPCSKRLTEIIPLWLPFCEQEFMLSAEIKQKVLEISPATIDRLLKPYRSKYAKRGLSTTKPGSILKKHIPIKTNQWDESSPGFIEADTVSHCGTTTEGSYAITINCVDILSFWSEQRAVWGKGEQGVRDAIKDMEASFPFSLNGFDCDNGSEFLNWHLYRYFSNRKKAVQFTRSRPYHKNDNAHVEQKNWTHIRQYLGYQRFDKIELVNLLNNLYTNEWSLYFNYFVPSFKLAEKRRDGSKIVKKHDKPKTPYQRLLESEEVPEKTKIMLTEKFNKLNPIKLQEQMFNKIKIIKKLANCG